MKISKQNLKDVSQLIFDGFLSDDLFFFNTYFTLRTIRTDERESLLSRYKYLSKSENFFIIIDLLTISIESIGGIKIIDKKRLHEKLLKMPSFLIMILYKKYDSIENKINSLIKIIEYYLQTDESKYFWRLFKNTNRVINFNEFKKINNFQYYWIVLNSHDDLFEEEKREWAKIEYMTNSICAFVNPSSYRRVKSSMNISEKISKEYDSKLKSRTDALLRLEKSRKGEINIDEYEEFVSSDLKIFSQLRKKESETKEEYTRRIEEMMIEQMKGNVVDDHDKQVRLYEINLLKKLLIEKRVKTEVMRNIRNKKKFVETEDMNKISEDGIFREEVSVLGDSFQFDNQLKDLGFYHNNVSYLEIINEKAFSSIPKEEKERAFKSVMECGIDVEKATETFLKNLYKDNKKTTEKSEDKTSFDKATIGEQVKNLKVDLTESDTFDEKLNVNENVKNAAKSASKMNIVINSGKDLTSQIQKRNKFFKKDNNVDIIFFND